MTGDKWTRRVGYLAVFAVAAVAALLSYWHAVAVVGKHGEPGVYGHLYPATIDGLVVASSMVLLDSARRKIKAPTLAWVLTWAGIAATLGANVLNGIDYGILGSVIAAWPAIALVGAYEMIMVLIRSHAEQAAEAAEAPETMPTVAAELPKLALADLPTAQEIHERDMQDPAYRAAWEAERREPVHVGKVPWVESPEFAGTFQPPEEPKPVMDVILGPGDTQAVPVMDVIHYPAATEPVAFGEVRVQSPLSRLDRKIPADLRQTGSFPTMTD